LLTEQQWLFFPLIFWILANDIFDMAQAKRLFPLIAAGTFVGQILGLGIAAAAPEILKRMNVARAELLSMNVVIYLIIYLLISEGLRNVKIVQRPQQRETVREALTEGWGFVRDVSSFRYLVLAMVILSVAFTIVEFHFLAITSSHKSLSDADNFQTFYSLYNLGVTLVAIVIQTLFASRIINGLGLKNTFLIFPVTLIGGIAWILAFPTSLVSVVGGLALPWLGKNTIDESARKSFQALVPSERRGRVSMFMDSYLFAAGAITGSLVLGAVILLDKFLDLPSPYYIYLTVAAAGTVLTIWFTLRMRAAYDASLLNWRLKRRQRASGVLDKLDFDG
jgi:hypothetical protein